MSIPVMLTVMRLTFMFWLIVAYAIFASGYKRKNHFAVKSSAVTLVLLGLSALMGWLGYLLLNALYINGIYSSVVYPVLNVAVHILFFALAYGGLFICFDEKPITLLFAAVAGYCLQNIAVVVSNIVTVILPDNKFISTNPVKFSSVLLWLICNAGTYAVIWFVFAKAIRKSVQAAAYNSGSTVILSCVVVVVAVIIRSIGSSFSDESAVLFVLMNVCNIICCFVVLFVQFLLTRQTVERQENETIKYMNEQKLKQYEMVRENIDVINLKCHDLKHQLIKLKESEGVDKEYIDKLKESVSIYDSVAQTGNRALDTVLTDKNLYCTKNKIRLGSLVDGKLLNFMSVADIYSLFGNALDNAIEYVMTLDEEKRIVKLFVEGRGSLVSVVITNYYEGKPPEFVNGIPKTTKGNAFYHGYGMKSIKSVTEKHGGSFAVTVDGNRFSVSLLFNVKDIGKQK